MSFMLCIHLANEPKPLPETSHFSTLSQQEKKMTKMMEL